jgi:hypothetical protein
MHQKQKSGRPSWSDQQVCTGFGQMAYQRAQHLYRHPQLQ